MSLSNLSCDYCGLSPPKAENCLLYPFTVYVTNPYPYSSSDIEIRIIQCSENIGYKEENAGKIIYKCNANLIKYLCIFFYCKSY